MRKKILVVDDDPDLQELFRLSFEEAGFSVLTASNGIDGLKQARTSSPDLVLLDLVLPEMDGFTICEKLRHDRATVSLPIIILTGLSSELNRYAGLDCGANDYVTKPITPSELIAKIKKLLPDATGPATEPKDAVKPRRHQG